MTLNIIFRVLTGGLNHLLRRIIFSIHGHGKWFLKSILFMVWRNYSHWIQFGKFYSICMENISVLTKCNVLSNNEHLILIWFFLLIDNEIDLKNYFHVIKIQKITKYVYQRKSARCCIFRYLNRFQYLSKSCYLNKEKSINFLFIAVIYFPLSIQMNILTLYANCFVILTSYMIDSALEPSYNLSKIFYYCHGYWNWS